MQLEQLKSTVTLIKTFINKIFTGGSLAISNEVADFSVNFLKANDNLKSLHTNTSEILSSLNEQYIDLKAVIDKGDDSPDMLVSLQHMQDRLSKAEENSIHKIAEQVELTSQLSSFINEKRDELIKSLYEHNDFQYKKRIRHGFQKLRSELPQIDDNEDLKKDLNITPGEKTLGELKPTQKDFDENKILTMIAGGFKRPNEYVISKDGYILDGHHRWASSLETLGVDSIVPVYIVDMNIRELLNHFNKGETVSMPKKDLIDEHKKLVDVLADGTEKERDAESAHQQKELDEYMEKGEDTQHYAVGILSNNEGGILFLKRHAEDSFHPGEWNLPGGHIDSGENPEDAVKREMEEETNLEVTGTFEARVINEPGAMIHYYWISVGEEKPLALLDGESDNAKWMTQEEWQEEELLLSLKDHLNSILTPNYIEKSFYLDLGDDFGAEASFKKGISANKLHKGKVAIKKLVVKKGKSYLQTYWVTPDQVSEMEFKETEHGDLLESKLPKDAQVADVPDEEIKEEKEGLLSSKKLSPEDVKKVVAVAKAAMKAKKPFKFDLDGKVIDYFISSINEESQTIVTKDDKGTMSMPFSWVLNELSSKADKVQSKSKKEDLEEDDSYKVIKKLGGSTGAVLVEDKDGIKWVRKGGASKFHKQSEYLALELYKAMGVPVPNVKASKDYNYTSFVEGDSLGDWEKNHGAGEVQKMWDTIATHFAADALLGNWDVIGLDKDNIIIDKISGVPVRVDVGGSLEYRAQGEKKKKEDFGPKVKELTTLRDEKMNPQTAIVFGNLSDEKIVSQVSKLPSKVPGWIPSSIRPTLNKRLTHIKEEYAGLPTNLDAIELYPLDKSEKKPLKDFYKKIETFMTFNPKDQAFLTEMVSDGMNSVSVLNYLGSDESAKKHMGLNEETYKAYIDDIGISPRELLAAQHYTGNSYQSINSVLAEAVGTPSSNIVAEGKVVMTKGPKGEKFFTANEMMYSILQEGEKTIGKHEKDGLYNVQQIDNLYKLRKVNSEILATEESDPGEKHMAAYYMEKSDDLLKSFNKKKAPTEHGQYHPSKEVMSNLVEIKDMGLGKNPVKFDKKSMMNQWASKTAQEYLMIAKLATRALAKAEQYKGSHKYVKSGMVSRKLDISGEENNKLFRDQHQPGNTVIWPRFSSTSTSFGTWSGNVKVKVAIKKSLYMDPVSHHSGEKEVLLKPFSRLKVGKWDDDFGSSFTVEHIL